jgi:hypothetical protein
VPEVTEDVRLFKGSKEVFYAALSAKVQKDNLLHCFSEPGLVFVRNEAV